MTAQTDHVVLVGYGRVGSLVGETLKATGKPFLVIEDADKRISALREQEIEAIVGNAARSEILEAANLAQARELVVAIPNAFEAGQVVGQARAANPALHIIARAHSDAEVEHLSGLGANVVIMGEREIARGMLEEINRPRQPNTMPPAPAPEEEAAAAAPVEETAPTTEEKPGP